MSFFIGSVFGVLTGVWLAYVYSKFCGDCFHDWSTWKTETEGNTIKQARTCSKCNYLEQRKVWYY